MSDPLDEEETWDENGWDYLPSVDGGSLEIRVRVGSRLSAASLKREGAKRLLAGLLAASEEERDDLLEEPRFLNPLLFELLIETGHAQLLGDPGGANEMLGLATRIFLRLHERALIEDEGLAHVLCLAGTARRLLGDLPGAEAAFERAATIAVSPHGRGFFCRALAVLRWDQGRSEEAAALLHQARRRFSEGEDFKDETVCLALLGLLSLEEGQTREAAALLQASAELDSGGRPWLAAQVWLGRALCFATAGERYKAKAARQTAWTFYGEVSPEEALLSVYWLEGRGAALAGDLEDAARLLDAVRRKRIEQRCLPEATLTTIDLGLTLHAAGRGEEIGALVEDLAAAFEGRPRFDLALGALTQFAEDLEAGRLEEVLWQCVAPALRLAFRLQDVPLRPVPFV